MTWTEMLTVITALVLLITISLPVLFSMKRKHSHLFCASNLKRIGVCYRAWNEDQLDERPASRGREYFVG